jgi:hypothetical protein
LLKQNDVGQHFETQIKTHDEKFLALSNNMGKLIPYFGSGE